MTRTAVAIRHLAFEDLSSFAPALKRAGYDLSYLDIGLDPLSTLRDHQPDLLFVLGGPIGAYEDDRYPFLHEEIAVIQERLKLNLSIVGICLGAQLMARALGARVYPGPAKEIGFAPIELTEAGRKSCLRPFEKVSPLHWHGDTFDLPDGAVRLASTPLCQNQAFSFSNHAIAFQFHPEAGGEGFERWLIGHTMELSSAGVDVNALREAGKEHLPGLGKLAEECMGDWLAGIRSA